MIQIDGYSHEWERRMVYVNRGDSQQTPVDVCARCGAERRAVTDAAGRMVWLYRIGAGDWLTAAPMCKAVRSDS